MMIRPITLFLLCTYVPLGHPDMYIFGKEFQEVRNTLCLYLRVNNTLEIRQQIILIVFRCIMYDQSIRRTPVCLPPPPPPPPPPALSVPTSAST